LLHKLVQIVGYADDRNIMAITCKAAKETSEEELTCKANERGLVGNEKKKKGMAVQTGQYETEMVNKFIYLGNTINYIKTENKEIQRRINYAN
jgi:hypothetical protein